MRLGRVILFGLIPVLLFGISCGPGYKVGDDKIKRTKNIHNYTVIKRSKLNYDLVKERKKQQRKINRERWKKQMKNRFQD